jgi:hypothetical protein
MNAMNAVTYAPAPDVKTATPQSMESRLERDCDCASSGETCSRCAGKKKHLQRKPSRVGAVTGFPPIVDDVLGSPGDPLETATRRAFEQRFDRDFSDVRIHTDRRAAESADAVNAKAYTVGSDLVFGHGQFAPSTPEGQRLVAHELTHVLQQRHGGSGWAPGEPHEREADAAAAAFGRPGPLPVVTTPSARGIARQPNDGSGSSGSTGPTVTPAIKQALIEELQRVRLSENFEKTTKKAGTVQINPLDATTRQHANRTVAVAAIIKPDGTVSYESAHFDEGMTQDAEPQLLAKIASEVEEGDTVAMAIDQVPCGADKKNCSAAIKTFRKDPNHGSIRVFTVRALRKDAPATVSPGNAGPEHLVSPKTAITRPQEERILVEHKEFRRVRLPLYKEPPKSSSLTGGTPSGQMRPGLGGSGSKGLFKAIGVQLLGDIIAQLIAAWLIQKFEEYLMAEDLKRLDPEIQTRVNAQRLSIAKAQRDNPGKKVYAIVSVTVLHRTVTNALDEAARSPSWTGSGQSNTPAPLPKNTYYGTTLTGVKIEAHDQQPTPTTKREFEHLKPDVLTEETLRRDINTAALEIERLSPEDQEQAFEEEREQEAAKKQKDAADDAKRRAFEKQQKEDEEKRRQAVADRIVADQEAKRRAGPTAPTPELRGSGPATAQPNLGPFMGPAQMDKPEQTAYAAQVFRNRRAKIIARDHSNPSGDDLVAFRKERDQWLRDLREFFEKIVTPQLKSGQWSDAWPGVQDLKFLLAWANGQVSEDNAVLSR